MRPFECLSLHNLFFLSYFSSQLQQKSENFKVAWIKNKKNLMLGNKRCLWQEIAWQRWCQKNRQMFCSKSTKIVPVLRTLRGMVWTFRRENKYLPIDWWMLENKLFIWVCAKRSEFVVWAVCVLFQPFSRW